MIKFRDLALASVGIVAMATSAAAQEKPADRSAEAASNDDIIVTARRRNESAQDVPLTVNAIKADTLAKLNLRDFKDIQTIVPGLTLAPALDGIAPAATLRGVNYDVNNSGSNATIQFYLNDAPISASFLFQSLFDIGEIEVLRGPQGTLRGIAAPSGSITVTTRKPDLDTIGGYVQSTVNTIGGVNVNGAVNVPIIKDMLAVRVAGIVNDDENTRLHSINNPASLPYSRARGERVTVLFQPVDGLQLQGSYQHYLNNIRFYEQVESANLATGAAPAGVQVTPFSRTAVEGTPRTGRQKYNIFNLQGEWRVAGQKLNYTGSWSNQDAVNQYVDDIGNYYGTHGYPGNASASPITSPNLLNYGQNSHTRSMAQSHEVRVSSEEPVFGMIDYVVGGLINRLDSPTDLLIETPVFLTAPVQGAPYRANTPPVPGPYLLIAQTPFPLRNRTLEKSVYGNLTAHIGESTEISGGLRYIDFNILSSLTGSADFNATVYSASVKHRFNDNILVYASTGSSWRIGSGTNGVILGSSGNLGYSDPALLGILAPKPETSKSYEAGIKTDWLDRQLRVNVTYYHQDFKNYIFSSPAVLFLANNGATPPTYTPNFTRAGLSVGVPVKVDGVEGEVSFAPSRHFNIGANASYSLGKITNGLVPCSGAALPTAPKQINFCTVSQRSGLTAPFSASVQSEYTHDIAGDYSGFLRGQLSFYGKSQVDPVNTLDDVKAYGLLNVFAGIRNVTGAWEVTAYAKNILNEKRVLSRDAFAKTATYATATGGGGALTSDYRGISITAPREFGLTARYAFGSR